MTAVTSDTVQTQSRWAIALRGLIGILIGVIILARPLESVQTLALVLALWAMFEGVTAIFSGMGLRRTVGHWWLLVLGGVVSVVIGVVDLAYAPGLTLKLILVLTGWWVLVSGALGLYLAFKERKAGLTWGWTLAWSVLAIFTGVVIFANPGLSLLALMRVLAVFGVVGGFMRLALAVVGQAPRPAVQGIARHPLRM